MRRLVRLMMAMILLVASPAFAQERKMSTDPKIAVVEKMIDAWNTRNWQLVGELFAEDGVLHSMMIEPVVGRAAIASRINGMGAGISDITLDIQRIGRVGDAVIIERVDRFTYKGHRGEVPVVGILTVEGEHVQVWREYYDRAQLVAAMGLKEDFHK
jgi:limonene-1,2-epoxide hydrolase